MMMLFWLLCGAAAVMVFGWLISPRWWRSGGQDAEEIIPCCYARGEIPLCQRGDRAGE
jgi:hypothetical protein